MTVAIDPDETREYTMEADKDQADAPVFTLGVLDSLVRAYIDDQFFRSKVTKRVLGKKEEAKPDTKPDTETEVELSDVEVHRKHIEFVRFGLKGWRGLKTKSGSEVALELVDKIFPAIGSRRVVSDASLKRLSLADILEIGIQISRASRISEADQKSF